MMAALDDSLARVEAKLKEKGMWDNTLLIVSTDNGGLPGNIGGRPQSIGSNMPLRAGKATVFQGGVRGAAFVNGGILPNKARGTVIDGPLMHATDWFATIANLAGVGDALPGNLDSVDLWPWLSGASRGATRDALPLNINRHIQVYPDFGTQIALVDRDGWKLVINEIIGEAVNYDGWFPIPPAKPVPPPTNPTPGRWLFNIRDDPAEKTNLYRVNQTVVRRLEATLAEFEKDYQPHQDNFPHLASLPAFHDGVWAPFKPIFSQARN
jgi:arylsulfatase B